MSDVYKRELKSYFNNMLGPVFIAWVLAWMGFYVRNCHFVSALPNFEYVVVSSSFLALLIIPLLTMRSFAEEKHSKTDQLLYSLPMRTSGIVLGKFFAATTVLAIPLAITGIYPLVLRLLGEVRLVTAYVSLLAMFLLGAAILAICMFISSLTESQVIAAVLSIGAVVLLYAMNSLAATISHEPSVALTAFIVLSVAVGALTYFLTKNWIVSMVLGGVLTVVSVVFYSLKKTSFEGLLPELIAKIAPFERLVNFANGLLDVAALVYYISLAGLFLFLTTQSLEKKRWA